MERPVAAIHSFTQRLGLRVALLAAITGICLLPIAAKEPAVPAPESDADGRDVQPAAAADRNRSESGLFNLQLPTAGGKQFWTDHRWQDGWRIQQNAVTGHWRLLDPGNIRQAWGSRSACEQALSRQPLAAAASGQHDVILLHGLFRSAASMQQLGQSLKKTRSRQIVLFEYASTRGAIADHAAALREVVEGLPPTNSLSFVGHSMGNIVVRHALGDWERAANHQLLDRVKTVVMLGPPNQGAAIARQLARLPAYRLVAGQGGVELGPQWEKLQAKLAIPTCPFGIIAGRLPEGFTNPLIGDAGDFVVSVEETKLPGGALLEVNQVHSLLMNDSSVQRAVADFLEHKHFSD